MGKARQISLGNDFGDVVINANGASVEIHADGSVVTMPKPAPRNENSADAIMRIAEEKARNYAHATITPNHLLFALIEQNPQQFDALLEPQLKAASILRMLDNDMRNVKRYPQTLQPAGAVGIDRCATAAFRKADVKTATALKSDRLYGLELLGSMMEVNPHSGQTSRSTTLDYIAMVLSNHQSIDPVKALGQKIDNFAATLGENKVSPAFPPGRSPC